MLRIFFLTLVVFAVGLAPSVMAQTNQKGEQLFMPLDIEKIAYPNTKDGCGQRAAMFFAVSQKYKEGADPISLVDMKILEPLVTKIYATIREKGLEKASLDSMKEYQRCVKSAPLYEKKKPRKSATKADREASKQIEEIDPKLNAALRKIKEHEKAEKEKNAEKIKMREIDMVLKHESCSMMNGVLLEILDAIKKRKKPDTLLNKYERNPPDFSWTPYEEVESPAILFVGQLYNLSKQGTYEDVVQHGFGLSVTCLGRRKI